MIGKVFAAALAVSSLAWAGLAMTKTDSASGRSCCPTGSCCVLEAPCCKLPQQSSADETVPGCCYPGSPCCYPGSPCCDGSCCPSGSCCPDGPCCGAGGNCCGGK